jgi:rsbT co-antagonist protein RsbR
MAASEELRPLGSTSWATQSHDLFQRALDAFTDPMFIKDRQHRWIGGNSAFFALLKRPAAEVLGKSDPDYFPPEQAEVFWRNDDALFASGSPSREEEQLTDAQGMTSTIWTRKYPIHDDSGGVIGLCGIITDVTDLKASIQRTTRLAAELEEKGRLLEAQDQLLAQLAVPVIQIWEGIVLLPIVGEITSQRGRQVLESLLNAIGEHRARYALIDITGVPFVDTAVARYLVQSVQAARLLGCQSIMVGLGASVASQMVSLGIDFSSLLTRSTLQQGLEFAMQKLSFNVQRTLDPQTPKAL